MANDSKKEEEQEGGEFADFMADITSEITQRVESLGTKPETREVKPKTLDVKPKPQPEVTKRTPAPVDAGLIVEWPNIADRMIEEMR